MPLSIINGRTGRVIIALLLAAILVVAITQPVLAGENASTTAPPALDNSGEFKAPVATEQAEAIKSVLPSWLKDKAFLIENWKWLGIALLLALAVALDRITRLVASGLFSRLISRAGRKTEPAECAKAGRPFGIMAGAAVWLILLPVLCLPEAGNNVLYVGGVFLLCLAGIWSTFKVIDVLSEYAARLTSKTDTKIDDLLVPLVRRTVKVFAVVFGVLFIADNLKMDVSSLIAGAGIGGLAFALAAKDTVANLFGSVTVLADRPFQIGDWVRIGDVDGSVEEVGLRTTRIRTFYNSLITMPNSRLTNEVVDNMGKRQYRRFSTKLGVTYDTAPEKIEAFCEGIREIIRLHPYTRKDYYHVYLNEFGPSSLNVMLYVFHEAPDWSTELRERHRLMIDIIRLAENLGVEFAFPTQTIHVSKDDSDPDAPPRPLHDQEKAFQSGAEEARRIVEQTLGKDNPKPPPVSI